MTPPGKRILLVNKFWRAAGGVENHAFAVKSLLEQRGHEVIPFAMEEPSTLPSVAGSYFPSEVNFRADKPVEFVRAMGRATWSHDSVKLLRKLLIDMRIDAAYVLHVYHQLGTAVLNELKANSVPVVLSLHDYKVTCPNYRLFSERTGKICTTCLDHKTGFLWGPVKERCWSSSALAGVGLVLEASATKMRGSYGKADVITTLNELQERAIRAQGIGVPLERVPHPVVLEAPRRRAARDYMLFIGRLVPEKGVELLVEASAHSRVPVRIVGDGRSMTACQALAARTSAPVTFLGELTHEQALAELRGAVALAVPSQWHEVSPLVIYEAIAADVPVVASAYGGMPDQIGEGRGYLVDTPSVDAWSAALSQIMENPEHAQERSAAARDYVGVNNSPERWETRIVEVFARAGCVI